jgi:hypothetical protein
MEKLWSRADPIKRLVGIQCNGAVNLPTANISNIFTYYLIFFGIKGSTADPSPDATLSFLRWINKPELL